MIAILIDTQVLVWLLDDDPRLGKAARRLLVDSRNEVAVSYFSLLEIVLKSAIGKMTYDDSVFEDISAMNLRLLPADRAALANYKIFDEANKDPFDNLLLAVAKTGVYRFMSSDHLVLNSKSSPVKLVNATK